MKNKNGFTLIELLIVIGIIAVLGGVMFGQFSGASESAKSAQCIMNLRGLAQAVQAYCVDNIGDDNADDPPYPYAGSHNRLTFASRGGRYKAGRRGWISGEATYVNSEPKHWEMGGPISAYEKDPQKGLFAITNGSIWVSTGKNRELYTCPNHKESKAVFSYVMNSYFGYDYTGNQGDCMVTPKRFGKLSVPADRLLLFAELPFPGIDKVSGADSSEGSGSSVETDGVLNYSDGEVIGFNHKSTSNAKSADVAHVAYADGHVGKLVLLGGVSEAKELTKWLCTGVEFTITSGQYEKVD